MRLLVIEPRTFFPAHTGARILSSNILRCLSKSHDVTILVNVDPRESPAELAKMRALCSELVAVPWHDLRNFTLPFYIELLRCMATGALFAVKKFCTPALRARAVSLAATGQFDAVICDTISAFMPDVDFGGVPCVLLTHNIEYLLRERQAERAGRTVRGRYLRYYARKTREFEVRSYRKAEHVAAVSAADAEHIRTVLGIEHVTPLPPGVDVEYFAPGAPEAPEPGIVFTGSMDWQANQDAAEFFVREVLPRVREAVPEARFTIVGRRPPPRIRALAEADPGHVEVTGTVDDVRPYIARARIAVVPVFFGSGIKIKVFEAMAMAKPVVLSPMGAEGLPLVHRDNALLAADAREMAAACVELLGDAGMRRRLGERARATVVAGHDWSVVAAALARICDEVVRRRERQ